jgi:hypothetical protein
MRDFFSSHIRNANTHRKEQDIAPSTKARAGTEHGYWIGTLDLPPRPSPYRHRFVLQSKHAARIFRDTRLAICPQ